MPAISSPDLDSSKAMLACMTRLREPWNVPVALPPAVWAREYVPVIFLTSLDSHGSSAE